MCDLIHFHHPSLHFVHNTFALILHSIQSLSILIMVSMALCSYILFMRTRWQGRCIDCLIDKLLASILIDSFFYSISLCNFHVFPSNIYGDLRNDQSQLCRGSLHGNCLLLVLFYTEQSSEEIVCFGPAWINATLIILLAKKTKK